jgi:hypothetical protein
LKATLAQAAKQTATGAITKEGICTLTRSSTQLTVQAQKQDRAIAYGLQIVPI